MISTPNVKLWWRASRPFAFPASVMPVILGTATAWSETQQPVRWLFMFLSIIGVMAMHAASNMFNDYFDYKKGVDRPGTLGSSGLLTDNLASPISVFNLGIVLYGFSALVGVYLWLNTGPGVLWLGILGALGGFFYTGGISLKYKALGDGCVFLFFGIFVTLGAYYVQTVKFSWLPVIYAIPIGLLIDGILHGNNIRDIASDAVVNVRTLAGRMSRNQANCFYGVLVMGAFGSIVAMILAGTLHWAGLLVFLSLPVGIRNIRLVFRSQTLPGNHLVGIDAMGAQLSLIFGILMTTGIILGVWM